MIWKDNAPYALCLSHDVDRVSKQWYHYCFYALKHPLVQWKSLCQKLTGRDPYWNFGRLMDLEKELGVRSTFFFLNEPVRKFSANFMGRYKINNPKVIAIIRELDRQGFEIGLHGSYYSYKTPHMLQQEKATLEEILGHSVVSTRQHHLHFDKNITEELHSQLGLRYDSTYGYSDKVGTQQPFRTAHGLIELPIALMDTVTLNDDVFHSCCEIATRGGLIVLNFHQCHFNPTEYPLNVSMYTKLLKKAKQDGAWIAPVAEIGAWLNEKL